MKIYIIPTGWDRELVLKTAFKSAADKVCLVSAFQKKKHTYSDTDIITRDINEYLIKELSKFTKVEVLEVDYVNFNDIVLRVKEYIKKNEGADFSINISTGSRMLAATLMFVAFLNNIDVHYSIAENHNPKIMEIVAKGEDYHRGFSYILEIPSLPFSLNLSQKEKKLLKRLNDTKSLSVKGFVDGAKGNAENRLRSEFHYLSKKLEKQGLVKSKNNGKKVEIELTSLGELCIG